MKEERIVQLLDFYLTLYIEKLTAGREEVFLAITGINQEELPKDYLPVVEDCVPVWVKREDYSEAVRRRNDEGIKKLVLMCADSIRWVDSLKDFVECPIIPDNPEILWELIRDVFGISKRDKNVEEYVNILIQSVPMDIKDLLDYLDKCFIGGEGDSSFSREKISSNIFVFGVWRVKNDKLSKSELQRQLTYSKPDVVRQKLEKALEDRQMPEILRRKITAALGKNQLDNLFKEVEFKDVEGFFRNKKNKKVPKEEVEQEDQNYRYSYDVCLEEEKEISEVEDIAEDYEDEENTYGADGGGDKTDGTFERAREIFKIEDGEWEKCERVFERLFELVEQYGVNEKKREKLIGYLKELYYEFHLAIERGDYDIITPVMLSSYCSNQEKLIAVYFEMLGWLLNDETMNHLCDGTELVEDLQTLFCREDNGIIKMPFYHPIVGLYFSRLKMLYETACQERKDMEQFSELPPLMVEQEKIWFPIRFVQKENRLYQLDYTSIREPGWVLFYDKESRVANSPVNFRLLNSVIEEYIVRNPYLGQLSISIVDLEDFQGLPLLFHRLQKLVHGKECLLSRVTITIVSLKERELRQELAKMYDMGMNDPEIYFRFTQGQYIREGHELELGEFLEDSDLLIFADTDAIYNSGKMIRYTANPNEIKKHLENFCLAEQLASFQKGKNYIELLWDTLQRVQNGGEAILSRWNNQELNMRKLGELIKRVQEDEHFEAVIVSANDRLLHHIYRNNNYQIRKSSVSTSESVILILSQKNKNEELKETGDCLAEISLSGFLDELSGEEGFCRQLWEPDNKGEIFLRTGYANGQLFFQGIVETEDQERVEPEKCEQFVEELIRYAFQEDSYLAEQFRNMLINEMYRSVDSYLLALVLYHPRDYLGDKPKISIQITGKENKKALVYKSTDVMELTELLDFFSCLTEVDERSVTSFREYYRKEMLSHALNVAERENLLEERMRKNMATMYERIKD